MAKLAIVTDATTTGLIGEGLPIPDAFVTEFKTRGGYATNAEAANVFLSIVFLLLKGHFKSRFANEDIAQALRDSEAAFDALLPG